MIHNGVVAVLLIGVFTAVVQPSTVQAQIPGAPELTIEIGPLAAAAITSAAADTVTATNVLMMNTGTGPKNILDALAWTLAKTAVQSLTQSIVKWINSGFQGSPGFITDLENNLGNLADTIADDFLNDLTMVAYRTTGINVRSPLQDQMAAKLREEFYRTTSSYGFDIRNPYTLGRTCSDPTGFTQGDFSKCGLNGWFALSQNPANNPWQRYQLAENELFKQIETGIQGRKTELGWGRGFLSWRGNCGPNAKPSAAVPLAQKDATAKCPVRTPGAMIENALGISATSPFRQLELADSINEIVAALAQQLVGQVLGGAGLRGASQPPAGAGSSYASQSASQLTAGAVGALAADLNSALTNGRTIQSLANQMIATYEAEQRTCSSNPTAVRYLEEGKSFFETNVAARAAILTETQTLLTDVQAAAANPNAPTSSISALTARYQTLIGKDQYPSRDKLTLAQQDTARVKAEIIDYVEENCR